jgi:hypothetical protein
MRERAAMSLREQQREMVIDEAARREGLLTAWAREADAMVRDPRRVRASAFLVPVLELLEVRERQHRADILRDAVVGARDSFDRYRQHARILRGLGPMTRFLRSWVLRRRAVHLRRALAWRRLHDREASARGDLHLNWRESWLSWQRACLEGVQTVQRSALELMLLRFQVGADLVAISIHEAAGRDSIMRSTADRDLALTELLARRLLQGEQRRGRWAALASLRTAIPSVNREESFWRAQIEADEAAAFLQLDVLIRRLQQLADRRELEALELQDRHAHFSAVLRVLRQQQTQVTQHRRVEAQTRIAHCFRAFAARLAVRRRAAAAARGWLDEDALYSCRHTVLDAEVVECRNLLSQGESTWRTLIADDELCGRRIWVESVEGHARSSLIEHNQATAAAEWSRGMGLYHAALRGALYLQAEERDYLYPRIAPLESLTRAALREEETHRFRSLLRSQPDVLCSGGYEATARAAMAEWRVALNSTWLESLNIGEGRQRTVVASSETSEFESVAEVASSVRRNLAFTTLIHAESAQRAALQNTEVTAFDGAVHAEERQRRSDVLAHRSRVITARSVTQTKRVEMDGRRAIESEESAARLALQSRPEARLLIG